jgi:hypothetical protein
MKKERANNSLTKIYRIVRKKILFIENSIYIYINTVDPVYSERFSAAKSVHLRWVFTINVFNLTIN